LPSFLPPPSSSLECYLLYGTPTGLSTLSPSNSTSSFSSLFFSLFFSFRLIFQALLRLWLRFFFFFVSQGMHSASPPSLSFSLLDCPPILFKRPWSSARTARHPPLLPSFWCTRPLPIHRWCSTIGFFRLPFPPPSPFFPPLPLSSPFFAGERLLFCPTVLSLQISFLTSPPLPFFPYTTRPQPHPNVLLIYMDTLDLLRTIRPPLSSPTLCHAYELCHHAHANQPEGPTFTPCPLLFFRLPPSPATPHFRFASYSPAHCSTGCTSPPLPPPLSHTIVARHPPLLNMSKLPYYTGAQSNSRPSPSFPFFSHTRTIAVGPDSRPYALRALLSSDNASLTKRDQRMGIFSLPSSSFPKYASCFLASI